LFLWVCRHHRPGDPDDARPADMMSLTAWKRKKISLDINFPR
jgi:hypothetical protein